MPGLKIATPAANDPVTLDMAKLHLRVTIADDDDLIEEYIEAATIIVEGFLSRSLVTKGYVQSLDYFPNHHLDGMHSGDRWNTRQRRGRAHPLEIKLLRSPLLTVGDITFYDTDGAQQTLTSGTDFLVDLNSEPGRIFPKLGTCWPITSPSYLNAVQIPFTAGYGADGTNVPASFKVAIKQIVANYYQFREPVSNIQGANLKEIPQHLQNLLWNDRIMDFAPTEG